VSITVDKKEGNQLTVTGGGSYMTKFFDIYTDDNLETKGRLNWRQCDTCFSKGNIRHIIFCKVFVCSPFTHTHAHTNTHSHTHTRFCELTFIGFRKYGRSWTRFSHHSHDFSDYTHECKVFNSAARGLRERKTLEKQAATAGTRIAYVKSDDRTFKASEKNEILNSHSYASLENTVAPCYHRDVLGEDERKMYKDLPLTHWLRSTVFCGLSLNARKDRLVMETLLVAFGVDAHIIESCRSQSALDVLWRDQINKKYVTMNDVSWF
jgi:hypothetical protein